MREFIDGERVKINALKIPYYHELTRDYFAHSVGIVNGRINHGHLPRGIRQEDIVYVSGGVHTFWFLKKDVAHFDELPKELFVWED